MKVLNNLDSSSFDIRAKIHTISEQWHAKTPKQKFLMLYGIPKKMWEIIGVRLYGDCHLNWYSYFGYVIIAYYSSMVSYTIYYWSCKGQFVYGLRCLGGMGIMISSIPLYLKSIGKDRFKYRSVLNFAGDYMYEDKKSSTSRFSMVCEGGAQKMLNSYLIMTCVMCTSLSLCIAGPMILFIRTGVWVTPLGTQFPYADQSDIAFCMDLIIQVGVGFLGIMICVSIELSQVIVNNGVIMGSDVITLNANELAEQLSTDRTMNTVTRAQFRNVIRQIQDFDLFISNFADIFYWRTFLGPLPLALSTAFCIFTQYMLDFPAGYGSAAASYIQLIILCYMGHNVRQANEHIYQALNEIPWYMMTPTEQRDFSGLLFRMQNGLRLRIGPLGELNYEVVSDLTKRIYQWLMLLIQFTS